MLFREVISVYADNRTKHTMLAKTRSSFLMLKQVVCIVTAKLDGVKERCKERKKEKKKRTKRRDELK
jgi:hypothetical protein